MDNIVSIVIGSIFVSNFVLVQFLGICPVVGVSTKVETASGMGFAVTFVITLASIITWVVQHYLLDPFGLGYLQTIAFILVIAALVQFIEMFLKKSSPGLYSALGIYLPLITTNCVVLGVAIVNIDKAYGPFETILNGVASSIGFLLAITMLAAIREKLEFSDIPEVFQGIPIALLSLGLMSIAFFGFAGMI